MDDKIIFLYAEVMMIQEIVMTFKEMQGAENSATLYSVDSTWRLNLSP